MLKAYCFILILFLFPFHSLSAAWAEFKTKPLCERTHADVLAWLNSDQSTMQMAVENAGGYAHIGLCWWHSRFHRAAMYLAEFNPALPKPTSAEAKTIFQKVTQFKPVTVPGYSGLNELTQDFSEELNTVLSDWQVQTTVFSPKESVHNELLSITLSKEEKQEKANQEILRLRKSFREHPRPIFVFLLGDPYGGQHSILITGFVKVTSDPERIYVKYIDSNQPGSMREDKIMEEGQFYGNFVPTSREFELIEEGFDSDFNRIEQGLKTICGINYRLK